MKLFWSFYLSLSEGSLSCHSAQQCSPNASIPVSLCISIHKASSSLLLPSTLEILNNVQKFHFIAQVMVLFEDSDCLGASQVKYLASAEIVVRWKAGPLLLLLQTKAEILMDFDFPDTSLGLDWYKQPKFTLRSVCLFVGCLFVLVWFGVFFCVQTKSWAMSVLPTLNSHLFVFKNICFKDFWAEELAGSHRSCCWPGIWNASLWCVGGCCTQGTGNGDGVWIHYQAPLAVTLLQLLVNNFISELCLLTV